MRFAQPDEEGFSEAVEQSLSHILRLVSLPSPTGFAGKAIDYCYQVAAQLGFGVSRTHKGGLVIDVP
ncbi:MAG: hypothetical protein OWU32_06460, partial [Firmicutes bacterium]|nr:hypothetical protein [Bacillota bacterium]